MYGGVPQLGYPQWLDGFILWRIPWKWMIWGIPPCMETSIWGFPKIGVPLNHPFLDRIFPHKPSIWGHPHDYGNLHICLLLPFLQHPAPNSSHQPAAALRGSQTVRARFRVSSQGLRKHWTGRKGELMAPVVHLYIHNINLICIICLATWLGDFF